MSFNLFLDDISDAPSGWVLARTADEAINFIKTNNVEQLSLDHDLGMGSYDPGQPAPAKTGMDVVKFMVDQGFYPARVTFHTKNPVGRKNMFTMLLRYGPYRVVPPFTLERNKY